MELSHCGAQNMAINEGDGVGSAPPFIYIVVPLMWCDSVGVTDAPLPWIIYGSGSIVGAHPRGSPPMMRAH